MLEVRDVVKHFDSPSGDTVRALDGVSMFVARGEMLALYGPSGSGKSTLLQIAAGLTRPDSGSVAVAGRDVTCLSNVEATRHLREVGLVLQGGHMIAGLSAIENAALRLLACGVPRHEGARRLTPLFERLGLGARADHRASDLSVGERQRVLIARALSTDPPLVLADEPTGSLDTQRGSEVLGLLAEWCAERGAAVMLATHDQQAASFASTVRHLRDGRLHDAAFRDLQDADTETPRVHP